MASVSSQGLRINKRLTHQVQDVTATPSSGCDDIAQGQPSVCSLLSSPPSSASSSFLPLILHHNFRQRVSSSPTADEFTSTLNFCQLQIDSSWGVDMKHHFKHRNIDTAMKAEIGSLLVRDLPWSDNRLINSADEFLSPTQRNTMIERWTRPNGILAATKGSYEWTAASKAPLPLQRKNWLQEAGIPLDQTFESLLTNFFNEVCMRY